MTQPGQDAQPVRGRERLERLGARVERGHDASHVEDAVALIMTAAIPSDHPEVVRARERGIPVLKRADALGAWVNRGCVVGIAGTHGKTTTTAMTTEVLAAAGLDPTGLVGGTVPHWEGNLRAGGSDLFVVEADEYDRSFHTLEPDVAVVTNLEADHLDVYGDLDGVEEGFRVFLRRVRPQGRVAVCGDDAGAARLLPALPGTGYSYGLSAGVQLRAVDVSQRPSGTRARVVEEGRELGDLELGSPGLHNLRNALAAAAVGRHLGASWDQVREGLAAYRGVGRRFQRLGEVAGVALIDDYAHHPTEIQATVRATRDIYPDRRLVAVFQPHLYSRTRDFHREFGRSLAGADVLWVSDVFPAREKPLPGITGALVADAATDAGAVDVRYHEDVASMPEAVAGTLRENDVLLVMGAGSVEDVGPRVKALLTGGADGAVTHA
ncbi:MAG: UDP-N-acetylmuramate--L-alanine ligase [Gemmatimonadetes bacterium]|nr:UDP-N-acetylmuramate--L-alanine ligase [Gemmatimonadota bacterium]